MLPWVIVIGPREHARGPHSQEKHAICGLLAPAGRPSEPACLPVLSCPVVGLKLTRPPRKGACAAASADGRRTCFAWRCRRVRRGRLRSWVGRLPSAPTDDRLTLASTGRCG